MSRRSRGAAGVALAAIGGLVVAGTTTAPWVQQEVERTIADATVTETVTTRGVEFAPFALPLGVAVAAVALALAALSGRPRRAGAVVVVAAAAAALVDVARGLFGAAGADGTLTAAAGFAAAACLVTVLGGVAVLRADAGPRLPARFDIDTDDRDDEWSAVVDPDDGEEP